MVFLAGMHFIFVNESLLLLRHSFLKVQKVEIFTLLLISFSIRFFHRERTRDLFILCRFDEALTTSSVS